MNVDLLNGRVLAYIGDSVMALKVKEYLVLKGITKAVVLQKESVRYLSAKNQAAIMKYLLSIDFLDDDEMKIYLLGRNYKSQSVAKNADIVSYRISSGYEALWGYLHLNGKYQRLEELWLKSQEYVEASYE